jgi:hypothetical protein
MTASSGSFTTSTTMDGMFKRVYGDEVVRVIPDTDKIAKAMPFVAEDKREGDRFEIPVELTAEGGVTFNTDHSVFDLNYPISNTSKPAYVTGAEILVRGAISYGAMQKALKADGGSKGKARAFVKATSEKVQNLLRSHSYFRECMLLYGGKSLGTIESVTSAAGSTLVVVITQATWAYGIWAGKQNLEFDLYSGSTKQNTNGSGATTVYKLTAVAPSTRTLTFTSDSGNVTAAAAGEEFYFAGSYGKQANGLEAVATTSGTLWGISTTDYDLWAPTRVSMGNSPLSFERLLGALERTAALGFQGNLDVYVAPTTWENLNSDQAALVRRDGSQKGGTAHLGYEDLVYHTHFGSLTIKSHIYVKQSMAFCLPPKEWMRVGATDITFEMPDGTGKIIRHMENKAGTEIRNYSLQAPFTKKPCFLTQLYDIVPVTT